MTNNWVSQSIDWEKNRVSIKGMSWWWCCIYMQIRLNSSLVVIRRPEYFDCVYGCLKKEYGTQKEYSERKSIYLFFSFFYFLHKWSNILFSFDSFFPVCSFIRSYLFFVPGRWNLKSRIDVEEKKRRIFQRKRAENARCRYMH